MVHWAALALAPSISKPGQPATHTTSTALLAEIVASLQVPQRAEAAGATAAPGPWEPEVRRELCGALVERSILAYLARLCKV